MATLRTRLRAGWSQFVADLRTDRFLRYILLLAVVLTGFFFWHRIPNFATRDEFSRILDALVPYGSVIEDPSWESLRSGVVWGRTPFGATTFLYGFLLLPVVVIALFAGQGEAIAALASPAWEFGFYEAWHTTPEWIWTLSIALVRLANVAFAVGSVYLTYRIGVELASRPAGRLASLFLTLSFGFLTIAHEGGEDMPATFLVLLSILLLARYVRQGDTQQFLAASVTGGLAIGFKLTAAPVIVVIAVAHLLRVHRSDQSGLARLQPGLVLSGALLGLLFILVSFPTAVVGRLDLVVERIVGGSLSRASHPTGPDAPILWWFLRGYLSALGLPLFVGSVTGIAASLWHLRDKPASAPAAVLVFTGLFGYLLLFSGWHDFRVHHLLPTIPLAAILLGWTVTRFWDRRPSLAGPLLAILLITSSLYAGVGVAGYADMPRDDAVTWLETEAEEDAVLEVYRRHLQDTAVPHSMTVQHAYGASDAGETLDPCPTYIQLGYRDLLYLAEDTYYRNGIVRASYVRSLVSEEYGYEIVAEFGPRPPNFVPDRPTPGVYHELLRLGIVPQTDQYADEQELRPNQYTLILERTGECDQSREQPF
ncbi:MAG: ArnT family glycosyltransferase [Halobacteriota archaeon]